MKTTNKMLQDDQKKIIYKYWKDLETLPLFINNTNFCHIQCKEMSHEIYAELSILFEPLSLSIFKISKVSEFFIIKISDMITMEEECNKNEDKRSNVGFLYYKYILDMFEYYLIECENYELYESANNIKRFLDKNKEY